LILKSAFLGGIPVLDQLFKNHIFIGLIGPDKPISAIQHETKLYLVNHDAVAEELFYQLGLRQFGRMGKLNLKPAPNIADLVRLVAQHDEGRIEAGLDLEEVVKVWSSIFLAWLAF